MPSVSTGEGVNSLITAIADLMSELNISLMLRDFGVSETQFFASIAELADKAFEDRCTTANPIMPLVSELKELYRLAYYGDGIEAESAGAVITTVKEDMSPEAGVRLH